MAAFGDSGSGIGGGRRFRFSLRRRGGARFRLHVARAGRHVGIDPLGRIAAREREWVLRIARTLLRAGAAIHVRQLRDRRRLRRLHFDARRHEHESRVVTLPLRRFLDPLLQRLLLFGEARLVPLRLRNDQREDHHQQIQHRRQQHALEDRERAVQPRSIRVVLLEIEVHEGLSSITVSVAHVGATTTSHDDATLLSVRDVDVVLSRRRLVATYR